MPCDKRLPLGPGDVDGDITSALPGPDMPNPSGLRRPMEKGMFILSGEEGGASALVRSGLADRCRGFANSMEFGRLLGSCRWRLWAGVTDGAALVCKLLPPGRLVCKLQWFEADTKGEARLFGKLPERGAGV